MLIRQLKAGRGDMSQLSLELVNQNVGKNVLNLSDFKDWAPKSDKKKKKSGAEKKDSCRFFVWTCVSVP